MFISSAELIWGKTVLAAKCLFSVDKNAIYIGVWGQKYSVIKVALPNCEFDSISMTNRSRLFLYTSSNLITCMISFLQKMETKIKNNGELYKN